MCHQRERLIAYIYNECDAAERQLVQRHVDGCDECRAEVAGLRSVREDLLAFDVPDHESVWRPFVTAPVTPWWRQVPAWAMATAAGVVMLSGAAGGAALQAFMPGPAAVAQTQVPVAPQPAVVAPTPVGLTSADLTAAEQRWLAQLRTEVGAVEGRVLKVSNRPVSESVTTDHAALSQEVLDLRQQNQKLSGIVTMFVQSLDQVSKAAEFKNADLQTQIRNLTSVVNQLVQVPVK